MTLVIYEFDALVREGSAVPTAEGLHTVPHRVFDWLETQCLSGPDEPEAAWLKLTQRFGRRAVQVKSFVGVIRTPGGYQIEVLPKIGKAMAGGAAETRQLLIDMLSCLREFRHLQTPSAKLCAARMPLPEVFISEFLHSVHAVVKRGIRHEYSRRQDNLFAMRGKLLLAENLRLNLIRPDRFFVAYDEFSPNRPENRLVKSAICRASALSTLPDNQKIARELAFIFADIRPSVAPRDDFRQVRLDRGMGYYAEALAWARLMLYGDAPLTGSGGHNAPSLLFPMEKVFEAYVAKQLAKQLVSSLHLKTHARRHYLVRHRDQSWFRLIPDLIVQKGETQLLVLDTKWKLLDNSKATASGKYDLSQSDFYQLQAYGQNFLDGDGDVALIYPKTKAFDRPLPVFLFPKTSGLRLWVLPFCLKERRLVMPTEAPFRWMAKG